MEVMVKCRGLIACELGFSERSVELPKGSTAAQLLELLGVHDEVSYTVDGAWRTAEYELKDKDAFWLYAQTMIPGG
ncbi:MAG: hypothetical protein LBU48_06580 [Coriobacteriales bacterium]|jgi:sulfur carrier protein ThiS|nr:hypothetical protein [Coriobacteriales bacterium]